MLYIVHRAPCENPRLKKNQVGGGNRSKSATIPCPIFEISNYLADSHLVKVTYEWETFGTGQVLSTFVTWRSAIIISLAIPLYGDRYGYSGNTGDNSIVPRS